MSLWDKLTGNDQRKRAEEERQRLEVARQMSLRRAQQSSNPRVAQQATQKLQNNGWKVKQTQQPSLRQNIENATGTVGLGLGRSAIGTAQGLSGMYDLMTPGKGTNRFSQSLDTRAKRFDQIQKDQNRSEIGYKTAQFLGDAGTFLAGGGLANAAVKGASKAPTVVKLANNKAVQTAFKPIAKTNSLANKGINAVAQKGSLGRITAVAAKNAKMPGNLIESAVDTGIGVGQMASKGQQVRPQDVALQAAISTGFNVGLPGTAQGVKEVFRMPSRTNIPFSVVRPEHMNAQDIADLRTWRNAMGTGQTMNNPDMAYNGKRAAAIAGVDYTDRGAIDDVLRARRQAEDAKMARQEKFNNAKQAVVDVYQKAKDLDKRLGQGGFVRNPLVNPDGTPRIGKVPKNSNKASQQVEPNQSLEMGTQKTQQTQPNLSQAKNTADGLTSSKMPEQQPKQGEVPNPQAKNKPGNTYTDSKQQRGFKSNMAQDTETPLSVYKDIPGYNVKPNAKTIGNAAKRVAKDPEGTYNRLLENGIQKTDDSADALVLLRNLVENDELDKAGKLAQATAKAGTDFGQAVQIFSAFRKTTPDGALRDAWNTVNAYNAKNPKKAPIRISKEQTKRITELANDLQKETYGTREWAKKAALLEREKGLLTPNTFLSKVSTVQTMAQLLNPKTAIRNVIGNGVLDLVEDLARIPATGLDKALKALGLIDERNMVLPSMKTNWANKLLGFKQGVEDVNLGIRTTGSAGNYDLTKEVFKPGSVGNKLEKLLGYELSSMDKAFFTGRYQSSLENMMKAQGVKTPTPEMKLTAEAEALYATFQNNSNLAKALQKSKNAMNFGKEWGLGDFILKYPKTPGNIVNVGLDYSPVGFMKSLKSLHDGIKLKSIKDIRNGELLLGRSLVGSGLIAGGAFLATQGIITGKQDGDFDKSAADKELGQGPFTFNITALGRLLKGEDPKTRPGDITANYDWLQPNAIQLSMGANMVINNGSADKQINAGIESLGAGIDTISEQPVFKGVKEFVGDLNTQQGGGVGKAMQGVAMNSASSFVPSLVNQVGQQFDNTKRSTYDKNPAVEALNKVKGRTPGARNTLYPALNTLGQEQKQYDVGGNNPLNVFFNPAFLNRVKDSQSLSLADELNKATGETTQYPRSLTGKQTLDGVKTKLTAEQLYDMKKNVGKTTDEIFKSFANNPDFQALPNNEKVKILSGALTDINAAGRATVASKYNLGQYAPGFNGTPTKLDKGAKQILSGNYDINGIINKSKANQESTKTPKAKTSKKKSTRKTSSRKSGSSKARRVSLPNWTNISPSKGLVNTRVASVKYAPVKKPIYKGKKVARKIA